MNPIEETVVEECRLQIHLFSKTHPHYQNRVARVQAWNEIARNVVAAHPELVFPEDVIGDTVKKTYYRLRAEYGRIQRKLRKWRMERSQARRLGLILPRQRLTPRQRAVKKGLRFLRFHALRREGWINR